MDECFHSVLAFAVFVRMGDKFTRDLGFASWDNEGGPL